MTAADLARELRLAPHPEGGWYRETWRSPERIPAAALPARFGGERCFATSILYLLGAGDRSCFHRLKADELWTHHAGGTLWIHLLEPGGPRRLELSAREPQVSVPHGVWFASEPAPGAEYVLCGCWVSPGFEFEDFEMAARDALLQQYPAERELVLRFTRASEAPACP